MTSTVFIYPGQIEFTDTCETQTIKIFNPYDFPIYFHFQSTRPSSFALSNVEGFILAQHSLDVAITLHDKTVIEEKFQVRIHHTSSKGVRLGEKIIRASLRDRNQSDDEPRLRNRDSSSTSSSKDEFQDISTSSDTSKLLSYKRGQSSIEHLPNEYFIYFAFLISVFLLFLPHDRNPNWPDWCHVSVNLKLVAAYILGIVTVFIIRK